MKRWILYALVLAAAFAVAWTYSVRTEPDRLRRAMTEALAKKDVTEVRRLLDRGFDPAFIAELGDSPLSLFVEVRDHERMQRVLAGKADPNHLNRTSQTCLQTAIQRWDLRAVEMLLEAGADPNPAFGYDGGLLHQVLYSSRSEAEQLALIKRLVEHGADVNAIDEFDGTPLREAIDSDRPRITAYLLSKGANPRLKSRQYDKDPLGLVNGPGYGRSPLHARLLHAALSGQPSLPMRLDCAFDKNDVPTLIACLEEGGDPNHRNRRGDTLLHRAIQRNNLGLVRTLARHGACVEAKGATGLTPMMLAASKEQLPTVQYLIALGARSTAQEPSGKSAMDYAKADSQTWRFLHRVAQPSNHEPGRAR